ncbi:MAG TPA: carbonic anhydrase [Bryobacteraceae bacterium]|nr:carbonic anhydrase [Bryobacteraceae bacterium]
MWRRDFIALLPAGALAAQSGRLTADESLKDLLEGNERFMSGKTMNPRRSPADFSKLAPAQAPDAVIVGCSDSRVPPEILFDQGVGDLFVIRVAGNVVSGAGPTVKGSIAYGVVALGAPLVMVLGHSQCGAVKAALDTMELAVPESIRDLVRMVSTDREKDLDRAIVANVRSSVAKLKSLEPTLTRYVETKRLKVIGAVYDLASGKVTLVA